MTTSEIEALSYDQTMALIEESLLRLEQEKLSIDEVLKESRTLTAMIQHCRNKISEVNKEVEDILSQLNTPEKEA